MKNLSDTVYGTHRDGALAILAFARVFLGGTTRDYASQFRHSADIATRSLGSLSRHISTALLGKP